MSCVEGGFAAGATTDGPVDSVPEEGENLGCDNCGRRICDCEPVRVDPTDPVVSPVPVEGEARDE